MAATRSRMMQISDTGTSCPTCPVHAGLTSAGSIAPRLWIFTARNVKRTLANCGSASGQGARGIESVPSIDGAVAGGIAGSAVEEHVTKKNALEITVKLDGGQLIAVVQEMGEYFRPGERVRVLSGSGSSRVTH